MGDATGFETVLAAAIVFCFVGTVVGAWVLRLTCRAWNSLVKVDSSHAAPIPGGWLALRIMLMVTTFNCALELMPSSASIR